MCLAQFVVLVALDLEIDINLFPCKPCLFSFSQLQTALSYPTAMISFDQKGLGIKVGLSPFKKIVFIYFNESPLKMMKNAFYFMLKAIFIFEMFTFLCWLYMKTMVNFKIYVVTNWTQIITMHILPIILRGKTMKCVQLIAYDKRNIFLGKLYIKCGREARTRPFFKNSKLSISLDQQSEML